MFFIAALVQDWEPLALHLKDLLELCSGGLWKVQPSSYAMKKAVRHLSLLIQRDEPEVLGH